MREIGLRAIAALCEQAADIADAVLLDSYEQSLARRYSGRMQILSAYLSNRL